MNILGATLFLTLCPELWVGTSINIGNSDFSIESKIENRIERFSLDILGCTPDRIKYTLNLDYNLNKEITVRYSDVCVHGIDKPFYSDIINEQSLSVIKRNYK